MLEMGKYLYCIIKEKVPKKFGIKGIGGKDVYAISEGKLSAIISDSEIKEYLITRENVLSHQKVIEEISEQYDVLPVSFGMVAVNSKELKEKILKSKAKELLAFLKKIEGKTELDLRAIWIDIKSIFQEIANTSQTIQDLKKSKSLSYRERISAGELVSKIFEKKKEVEKEKILEPLKRIADDLKENKILGDDMVLNAAFLVKKEKEKEFDKIVNALGKKYDQKIKFTYIGPLPPFNFVELHLKM